MIIGFFHPGSGIGDQLFCYLATRTTAKRLNTDFGFMGTPKADFVEMDLGKSVQMKHHVDHTGKIIIDEPHNLYELKTPSFNPEFDFIPDNSVIDGCMAQDDKYFDLDDVREWLKAERLEVNKGVINFRGGEFTAIPELFLPKSYYEKAMSTFDDVEWEVHTDDLITAKLYFPDLPIINNPSVNWRSIRYAHSVILSNSAFGIIPALLSDAKVVAPRYWARRNTGEWSLNGNYYKSFIYI